jgi:hypothetical protein
MCKARLILGCVPFFNPNRVPADQGIVQIANLAELKIFLK